MENCTEYKRISNFEVLRIISMFMIIFNHFSYNVFWNNNGWLNLSLVNRVFVSSFFPLAGETGVAIFFMLAGYFGIEKNNISVIRVILEIIFYGWIAAIVSFIFLDFSKENFRNSIEYIITPVLSGKWWFATSYVFVAVFRPYINQFIHKVKEKEVKIVLIIGCFYFFIVGKFFNQAFYNFQRGIFLYSCGALYKLFPINRKFFHSIKNIILLLILLILSSIPISYFFWSVTSSYGKNLLLLIIFLYSIFIAILSLNLFAKIQHFQINLINSIAKTTFGIYLLHESTPFKTIFWGGVQEYSNYFEKLLPLYTICVILICFIGCSLIDYFRFIFLEPLALKITSQILNKHNQITNI